MMRRWIQTSNPPEIYRSQTKDEVENVSGVIKNHLRAYDYAGQYLKS
ncbi:hypothetical protein NWP07_01410 [Weissella cibaria]|nr:hypothetical protein [Weissella cibaria]